MSTIIQVNRKQTVQVRISKDIHKLAKIKAAQNEESIRSLVDGSLGLVLGPLPDENQ